MKGSDPTTTKHPDDAKLDRLEKLGELKEKGVLTAAEFREEKKKILSASCRIRPLDPASPRACR